MERLTADLLTTDGLTDWALLNATVMHKRLKPSKNAFSYKVYYVAIPLNKSPADAPNCAASISSSSSSLSPSSTDITAIGDLNETDLRKAGLTYNRFGIHAIYHRDHGYRDARSWREWLHDQLAAYQQPLWPNITLLTMPRVLGYVFNPVSFWLCRDEQQQLRAVICEVNNTFGETHSYLCLPHSLANDNLANSGAESNETDSNETDSNKTERTELEHLTGIIDGKTVLSAEKIFHVSPFLPRRGKYDFRFHFNDSRCDIFIDYCDLKDQTSEISTDAINAENKASILDQAATDKHAFEKVLLTSLRGEMTPLSRKSLMQAFWRCPLVTLKAITLIHVQALKIVLKKIKYIKKPTQLSKLHSATHYSSKMSLSTMNASTMNASAMNSSKMHSSIKHVNPYSDAQSVEQTSESPSANNPK